MSAISLHITGKVQGVSYRLSTELKADALELKGWVKNNPDGSVSVHAEGPEEKLEKLIEWCKKGPKGAEVESVKVEEVKEEGWEMFEIKRNYE